MTFEDDVIRAGGYYYGCRDNGIEWPPPQQVMLDGVLWERVSMSTITDEQRANLTHVFRGAEYHPVGSSVPEKEKVDA